MEFLKWAFIYKKHDTLRYVTFYIQKTRHFAKSKTIFDTFLYTKSGTVRYATFHQTFQIWGGGGHLLIKKNALCVIFYIEKTRQFALFCSIQRVRHYALRFNIKKKCTFRYIYIYIIYCAVLKPKYKCTYDQSNQIEK